MIGRALSFMARNWHRFWCGWYLTRNAKKARYHALKRDQWEHVF